MREVEDENKEFFNSKPPTNDEQFLPNYPYSFEPQVYNFPSDVTAAECLLPQDI